jgi:hypothetical protein
LKRNPPTPGVSATGQSTTITTTGKVNSLVASRAAWNADLPSPMCRWMFSSTTIALSTSGPIARNSPPRVITLIVFPVTRRPIIAPRIASGSDSDAITVIRQSPRNTRIINDTRIAPTTPSWTRLSIALRTYSDWSITNSSLLPSGNSASMSGIAAFTPSATARLLAPCWR